MYTHDNLIKLHQTAIQDRSSSIQTARRSNQSILREINPEYLLEGLMLKLKIQYFGHLIPTANSLEKSLMLERLRAEREEDIRG